MQENGNSENTFEKEMTRMMKLAILKIGNLETEVHDNSQRIGSLETGVSELKQEVAQTTQILRTISGQFSDVTKVVIKDGQRITKLESEVAELQSNIH